MSLNLVLYLRVRRDFLKTTVLRHGTVTFHNRYQRFGGMSRFHIQGIILMEATRSSETLVPNCTALRTRRKESSHSPIMIRNPQFIAVFKREPNFSCFKFYVLHTLLLQWAVACGSSVYLLCRCLISKYNTCSWMPKVRWLWWICKLESLQDSSGLIHCYVSFECAMYMDFASNWEYFVQRK